MTLSELHTLESVAKELGVSYKTLYARVTRGQVHTHQVGRTLVIDDEEYQRIKNELKFNKTKPPKKTPRALFIEDHRGSYNAWRSVLARCSNPRDKAWPTHGALGITVCERWKRFEEFLSDMGDRPPGLVLQRINKEGNYEPGNCEWVTWSYQNKTKRPWGSVSGRKSA